ncbi:MAG: hypothetical protein WKF79_16285 [Nocardioides sp.]
MTTWLRVTGFLAALAAAFGVALGVGNAVGPLSAPAPAHDGGHGSESQAAATAIEIPGGLMVSQEGYTFRLAEEAPEPGRAVPVSFTIEDPDGRPVTAYDVEHEKELHLIAVRRDFSGFQHVHPELDADGVWSTGLDLTPGQWRLFADFTATGANALTLGADLSVAGDYQPGAETGEVRTARVEDYTVTLAGDLTSGSDAELTLSVSRDGRPVVDLEPYLGAYGHLVALREGDLAYLHVHPDGSPGDGRTEPGPEVVFYAAVPSEADYRLYLNFQHDGEVRTAAFTLSTDDAAPAGPSGEEQGDDHSYH